MGRVRKKTIVILLENIAGRCTMEWNDKTVFLALQGPKSEEALEKLVGSLDDILFLEANYKTYKNHTVLVCGFWV